MFIVRLPVVVNDPTLPVIPAADIEPLFSAPLPAPEPLALEHWVFDRRGLDGLTGLIGGQLLTPLTDDSVIRYEHQSIVLANAFGEGLRTTIDDRTDITMAVVFRATEIADSAILMGTLDSSTGTGLTYAKSSKRVRVSAQGFGQAYVDDVPQAEWMFGLASAGASDSSGNLLLRAYSGGREQRTFVSGAHALTEDRKFVIGNGYSTAPVYTGGSVSIAEAFVISGVPAVETLHAAYARCKARMLARGIAVA